MPVQVQKPDRIYRPGETLPARDPWIDKLAHLMDGIIPIGPWSIGLDPLLGLVPGIGDLIGSLISMLIVARAVRAGIPRVAVARMMTNIAIDTLIGAIPVVGDVFDFAYKANLKNLRIYEDAVYDGRTAAARHWGFFIAIFAAGVTIIALVVVGILALARW